MSFAFRAFLTFLLCLIEFAGVFPSGAQVYVGGVQSSIGSPNSPWTGPVGVAPDTSGNMYIAQYGPSSSIVRIDATTHATTTYLSSACGLPLYYTQGLVSDSSNFLYMADQGNNRVVKYNMTTNTCVISYDVSGPFAVALDASGNLWATTDNGSNAVVSEIPAGATSSSAAMAVITSGLTTAVGLAFDPPGNMYVSDQANNTVWKYTAPFSNSNRSAFLTSSAGSSQPYGLLFDGNNNLYVCEAGANQVLKYLAPTYSTYVQVSPNITYAEGVGQDTSGNIFLAAYQGKTVTEISNASGDFGQINRGSTQTLAVNFQVVSGTAVGSFRVADQGLTGLEFIEQSPDTNPNLCPTGTTAYSSTTACSINVNFTPAYPGQRLGAIQALSPSGSVLTTAYVHGTGLAPLIGFSPPQSSALTVSGLSPALSGPRGPVLDPQGSLYVADYGNNRVVKIAASGSASVIATPSYTTPGPRGVVLDGAGNLYIGATSNIVKVAASGTASQLNNGGLTVSVSGVAVDAAGNVYAADSAGNRIVEWPSGGAAQVVAISGVTLSGPTGIVVNGSNTIFVADTGNNRIVQVTNGVASVVNLGAVTLSRPRSLAIDSTGNLYISDSGNNRVLEYPALGGTAVVLNPGFTLNAPEGAAVNGTGGLDILDTGNNRIVVGNQASPASITFAAAQVGSVSSDSPKATTVLNLGNQPLSVSSAVYATTTAGGTSFAADASTTCASTLAASATCVIATNFTAAAKGTNSGTLTLTDNTLRGSGATQVYGLSGTGYQIVLSPATLSAGTYGTSYSATISASGGTAAYTFRVVTGSLPPGLTLSGSGLLSGVPTQAGIFAFTVQATDSSAAPGPFPGTANYSVTIAKATPAVAWPTPADIVFGTALGAGQLNASASGNGIAVPGTFTYTPAAGAVLNAGAKQTLSVSFAPTDSVNDNLASATVSINVTLAPQTIAFTQPASPVTYGAPATISLVASGGGSGLPVVFSVLSGLASVSGSTITPLGVGTITISASQAGNANYTAAAAVQRSVVVAKGTVTSITLTSSANPVLLQKATTLTAIVQSGSLPITGNISFIDANLGKPVSLGSATLVNGVASLTLNSLFGGTHAITALYSGDANFLSATSDVLYQVITDFRLFNATQEQGNISVQPGDTTILTFYYKAIGTPSLPSTVDLSVEGLPSGATYTFTPQSIPANSDPRTVLLTFTLPKRTSSIAAGIQPGRFTAPIAIGLLMLPFTGLLRRRSKTWSGLTLLLVLVFAGTFSLLALSGCQPRINSQFSEYFVDVYGTSGAVRHYAEIDMIVPAK